MFKPPYTVSKDVYSPQRSAGLGRRSQLPEQYSLAYSKIPPAMMQQLLTKPTTPALDEMLMLEPSEEMLPVDTGVGTGAFGGEATANPSAVTTGHISPETGRTAEQIASTFVFGNPTGVPTPSSIFGFLPLAPVQKGLSIAIKGAKQGISALNEELGNPWGKFVNSLGLGKGSNISQDIISQMTTNPVTGLPLGEEPPEDAPSSLADIGIGGVPSGSDAAAIAEGQIGPMSGGMEGYGLGGHGGGGYGGGGYGMGGSEGVGGVW